MNINIYNSPNNISFLDFPVSKGEAYSLTKMPVLTMSQKYHNIHSGIYQIVFDRDRENIVAEKQ